MRGRLCCIITYCMARRKKLSDRSGRHDAAYRRAKRENYAARAIYKLEELDKKFRLLRTRNRVLDLGCWPGSWMQYVSTKVGEDGYVYGIDLREVELALPSWVESEVADVYTWNPHEAFDGDFIRFDVVLSDMAPQTTGDRHTDVFHSEQLCRRAFELGRQVLRPGGRIAVKVFQGGNFRELLRELQTTYQEAKPFHARNTRSGSTEQYLVGRGLKASACLPFADQAPA